MKIALINGSPKSGKSNSAWFLEKLEESFTGIHEITRYNVVKNPITDFQALCQMDTLVFSFPLYIDAIPSHLFRMMTEMERYTRNGLKKDIYVYAIVNNGFYEGKQNHIAMRILKNWCIRAKLQYGQSIGQGAGEMMGFIDTVPLGHGPLTNLGRGIHSLADHIESRASGEDMLFSPNFPRIGWRFTSTHGFWHVKARKNGLKIRDIKRRH